MVVNASLSVLILVTPRVVSFPILSVQKIVENHVEDFAAQNFIPKAQCEVRTSTYVVRRALRRITGTPESHPHNE